MKALDDIFVAFGTISKIPVPMVKEVNVKRSTMYFPVVGYIASLILFLIYMCINPFMSNFINATIILFAYYFLFGYFHFDGLLDVIDGFGAQLRDKEKRLEIMKDSRIGAFALLYGLLFVLLEFFSLAQFHKGWFLFPVFGRLAMVILLSVSKPASGKGLGAMYFPYPFIYSLVALILVIPAYIIGLKVVITGILTAIAAALFMSSLGNKKIDGINGDVIGATGIITEIIFLLLL